MSFDNVAYFTRKLKKVKSKRLYVADEVNLTTLVRPTYKAMFTDDFYIVIEVLKITISNKSRHSD